MKLLKWVSFVVIITVIILAYTSQQIALLKISYQIGEAENLVTDALDQNRNLRYNVASLESPENLARFVANKNPSLTVAVTLHRVVRLLAINPPDTASQIEKGRVFFNLFIPNAEASIDQVR